MAKTEIQTEGRNPLTATYPTRKHWIESRDVPGCFVPIEVNENGSTYWFLANPSTGINGLVCGEYWYENTDELSILKTRFFDRAKEYRGGLPVVTFGKCPHCSKDVAEFPAEPNASETTPGVGVSEEADTV